MLISNDGFLSTFDIALSSQAAQTYPFDNAVCSEVRREQQDIGEKGLHCRDERVFSSVHLPFSFCYPRGDSLNLRARIYEQSRPRMSRVRAGTTIPNV